MEYTVFNSNHIEGSKLTHDQTRYIFETNTIGFENEDVNVDDIIETSNHFRCIYMVIEQAGATLSEKFIKQLRLTLESGTSDSRKDWFAVGENKKIPNEVGGCDISIPEEVADKIRKLLADYNAKSNIIIDVKLSLKAKRLKCSFDDDFLYDVIFNKFL